MFYTVTLKLQFTPRWSCNTCKAELGIEGVQAEEEKVREEEKRPPVIKQEVVSPPRSIIS